jgi:hypothetical protein
MRVGWWSKEEGSDETVPGPLGERYHPWRELSSQDIKEQHATATVSWVLTPEADDWQDMNDSWKINRKGDLQPGDNILVPLVHHKERSDNCVYTKSNDITLFPNPPERLIATSQRLNI